MCATIRTLSRLANANSADRWKDFFAEVVGKPESSLTASDLELVAKRISSNPADKVRGWRSVIAGGPTNQIYFNDALGLPNQINAGESRTVYACCQILSSEEKDAALFFRSDGRVRLWLNGKQLLTQESKGDEYAEKFRGVILIHLTKGSNFLLAHVDYDTTACGFWAAITPDISAAIQRVADALDQRFTDAWCLHSGSSVPVNLPIFGIESPKLTFFWHGQPTFSTWAGQSFEVPRDWTESGVGILRAIVRGVTLSQSVFIGDPTAAVRRYREEFSSVERQAGSEHLYAALYRCEHLIGPDHFKPGEIDWQRTFATQAAVFEEAFALIKDGKNPFRGRTGEYFRAYRSAIDGAMQYCLVYVPRGASRKGGKLPVVLMTPAVAQNVRPFLDSIYAANGGDWMVFRMAEQFGCIVVLPGGRSNAYGNPIGLADMREAVCSLDKDLPIDWNRVSIQGWCSGGMYALMLASFFPDDYNEVGVSFSLTIRSKNMYPIGSACLPVPVMSDWIEANDPNSMSTNLAGISLVMVHHDIEDDPYNDPWLTLQTPHYAADLQRSGLPVKVWCFQRPGYYRGDEEELTFRDALIPKKAQSATKAVLVTSQTKYGEGHGIRIDEQERPLEPSRVEVNMSSGKRLDITSRNVVEIALDLRRFGLVKGDSPSTFLDGQAVSGIPLSGGRFVVRKDGGHLNPLGKSMGLEGPVSHMFARPFLVTCEDSSHDPSHSAERWCNKFRDRWKKDFFCDCRFKRLAELTTEDWNSFDVLVFCANPSRAVPKAGSEGRLSLAQDSVTIGKRKINGSAIGAIAIWRNPQWPDHYIAVATSNELSRCAWPDVNFAFEGWFDYIVWDTTSSQNTVVLEADRFDRDWR